MTAALNSLDAMELDTRCKGIPPAARPLKAADVAAHRWNLLAGDLPAPVAVVRQSALDANAKWIEGLLGRYGLLLAPHAKTTMSPHIFAHQAEYCWGLTVATAQQAEVAAYFGCRKLIVANELTGSVQMASIVALLQRYVTAVVYVFADTVECIRELSAAMGSHSVFPRLRLLIDVGFSGGRTGCRTMADAEALATEIALQGLPLSGVGGYEGLIVAATGAEDANGVERYFDFFESVAKAVEHRFADGELVLTAGGSSYYDVVGTRLQSIELERPALRVIRSGCYVTHDCGTYHSHQAQMAKRAPDLAAQLGDLEPALFVCGLVQSRPERSLALITMGKRDVGIDADLPVPVWQFRKGLDQAPRTTPQHWTIFKLNDQHAYLRVAPEDDVKPGDLLCFGISHPCTTFDRWRLTHLVDDAWTSIGVLPTFF